MGVIKKLYGKELVGWTQDPNTEIYPITHVGGVYDSNGNTLESLLGDMNNRIDYGGGGSGSGSSSVQPIIYLWAYCTASDRSEAFRKLGDRNQQSDVPRDFYADISQAEGNLKDNELIYMTTARRQGYNYMTWTDHYIWSVPIRMGNGETSGTGVDGDSINYIYCRRRAVDVEQAPRQAPRVPNITVQMVEFLSSTNGHGYNQDGQESDAVYNVWYDHPFGISEEYPEEWVAIAEGNDPEHDTYNTPATLWSRWGFNGRDGDGTEYIFMRAKADDPAPTWRESYHGRIGETETGATYYDVIIDNVGTDTNYQKDDFIPQGWHDEPQELNSTYPIQYVSIRKRQWVADESKSKWGPFSTPKVWSSVAETSGYSVTINNDAIILDDDTGTDDVKNVSCTKIHIWEGTAEITDDATYDYDVTINQRNGADYYFGVEKVTAISNGAVTTAPLSDASFEHAYPKSALYTNNLGLVLCLTKENEFINKDFSVEYNIKIYKVVNGSRSAQPVAEVSRSQVVKVADFNNGAAYQLQVTPNSLPVFRETSESPYQFPTDYDPTITVTARKSMEGSVSVQQIHYPSEAEAATLTTGDMFVEVKGVSFTGTEISSPSYSPDTGSGALDSLTFTLGDAYTNCSAYIVNLKFVIGVENNQVQSILVDTETVDFTVQGDRGINGVGSYTLELDNDNAILDDNTVSDDAIRMVTETNITLKYGTSDVDSSVTPYTIKLDAKNLPDELILKDLNDITVSTTGSDITGGGFYLATTGNPSPSILTLGDAYYVKVKAMVGNTWAAAKTFGLKIKNMNATGTVYRLNITNDSWSYESDNSIAGSAATSVLTVNAYTNGEPEAQSFTVEKTAGTPSADGFVLASTIFPNTTSTAASSYTLTQSTYASNGYDVRLYYNRDLVDSEHIDCVKNGAQGPAGPSGDADAADFYTLMPIKMEALVGADDRLTIDVAFNIQYTHGSQQSLVYGSETDGHLPAGYSLNVVPYLANGTQYGEGYQVLDNNQNGIWTFEDENTHTQKVIEVQTDYSSSNSQVTYFVARLTYSNAGVDTVKDSVNIPVRFANGVFFEINQEQRTITARIQESEVKAKNLLSTKADWYYNYDGSDYRIPASQYASNPYRYESVVGNTGDIYSPPILLPAGEYTVSVYSNEPKNTFKDNIVIALYGSTYPSSLGNYTSATVAWSDPVESENITIGGITYYHYVTTFSLDTDNYTSINWYPQTQDGDWLAMPQLYFKSIASNFSSIIQKADSINARVSSLDTTVNNANTGLVKKVTDLTATAEGITSTVSTIRNNFGAENLFSFNEAVNANYSFPYLYLVPEHYGAAIKWVANSNHTAWKRDWHVINLNKSIEAGKYTFSMKIYNSSANSVPLIFQLTNGTQIEEAGVTRSFQGPSTHITLVSGWNEKSFTLDTADGSDAWTTNIGVLNFGVSSGVINTDNQTVYTDFSLYIHYLKMEVGEIATAFRISSVDENAISQGSLIDAWTTETGKVSLEGTYNSMPVYKAACNLRNSSDTKWRLYKSDVTVKDNTCYTLSFWAKADVDGTEIQQNFYDHGGISRDDNSSMGQSYYGDINTTLTTQWKHYVHYWYTDFESAVVATVDWGQNVVITPGRMYNVGAANQTHRKLWASSSSSFNMISVDSSTESQYFSDTIDAKTVVGLQIMSEYETSVDNTKYVYIAGLSFDEGYVGEGPSSSSSMIKQTTDQIKLQVEDCGIDIDKKKITLNGNTEINGTLNLYDDTTGFILNGLGGITQISPKSVGNYYTDFKNISETVFNKTETTAGLFVSNSGPYALFKYDYYIYLGKYNRQTTITFNSITSRFYNSSNSNIIGNIINDRTVQIVEIYNSSTVTTTENYGAFTYTVANNDADIYLAINMTIGHLLSKLGSINATPYCDLTIQYEVPNDAFTLIGYDGIGINFGTGANIFFNKNEATFRYGNYGLKISNGNISKFIGERDTFNNEVWVNLNTPKIKVTNNNVSIWPIGTDMIVTTLNSGSSYQTVYLPSAPYTGRTVYIRKRGVSNVKVYATNTMMLGYNNTVNVGSYIEIDSGKEYKFTYDGTYWLVNYMD